MTKTHSLFHIPLINKPKLIPIYLASSLAGIDRNLDKKIVLLKKIVVRLIDKAIYEYNQAVDAINRDIEDEKRSVDDMRENGGYIFTHLIMNHLENCINSIHRIYNAFGKIMRNQNSLKIDGIDKKLAELYRKPIRDIRDMIEHIEEDIQEDKINNGDTIALSFDFKKLNISISDKKITIKDLDKIICKFYDIILIIINYQVPVKK